MASLELIATDILSSTFRLMPLYLFAGLGEIISEKSGVVNLGIEGQMLISAFVTLAVDIITGNPYIAVISSIAASLLMSIIFGIFTVRFYFDQIVAGLSFYLFGLGFSYVIYSEFVSSHPFFSFTNVPIITVPVLSSIPVIGKSFFQQNPFFYFAIILVPLASFFMNRTSFGLRIKAVGENPQAADNMGINVNRLRFLSVLIGGLANGLAGSYFEIGFLQQFQFNVIGGRGFVALALIYFANWGPYRLLLGSFLYNFIDAAQSEFVSISGPTFQTSTQLFAMLPYIFLVALIPIFGRKARPPKYLLQPYRKS